MFSIADEDDDHEVGEPDTQAVVTGCYSVVSFMVSLMVVMLCYWLVS